MAYPIEDIAVVGSQSHRRTILSVFDSVRALMNDENSNTFDDTVLLVPYNRLQREISKYLAELGASIGRLDGEIQCVVDQREYELPGDWMSFCREPNGSVWFHRSDADTGLEMKDQKFVSKVNTTSGPPSWFYVRPHTGGAPWIMGFDVPANDTYLYYFKYYPTVAEAANTGAYMPWMSMMDDVFQNELEFWARHWKEFTPDLAAEQSRRARLQVQQVLGDTVLEDRNVGPSMWRGNIGIDRVK